MFKKLLVPVDGSVSSFDALDVAIDMANSIKADVVILTVAQSMAQQGWIVDARLRTEEDDEELAEKKKMAAHIVDMAKIKAEKIEGAVEVYNKVGYPADVIVEQAKESQCDCIIMGSRGLSGVKKALLGSVSSQVAHTAEIPVLLVK